MTEGLSIRPQTLHLAPQYRRLRDTILRPHLRLTESRYFWERWKARLGADATVLIMEVRDRCNRALTAGGAQIPALNGDTDAPRAIGATYPPSSMSGALNGASSALVGDAEGCTVSANELAAACGFSRVTLWRLLQREDVRRFIRVEHNYVYDRRLGKKRRTVSTYHVAMEDPLVDEDEARLEQLIAASAGAVGAAGTPAGEAATPVAQNGSSAGGSTAPSVPRPSVQNEMLVVDNRPPRFQSATNRGGSIPKPQNVPETMFKERLEPNGRANGQTAHVGDALRAQLKLVRTPQQSQERQEPPPGADSPASSAPQVDIWRKYPELAHYVEEAEQLLGDGHSRGFYLKALKTLYPAHLGVWQRALGMAREQTNIRRSRGALFTRLLRTFAAEAGVEL